VWPVFAQTFLYHLFDLRRVQHFVDNVLFDSAHRLMMDVSNFVVTVPAAIGSENVQDQLIFVCVGCLNGVVAILKM
jgi:hypothetical protein